MAISVQTERLLLRGFETSDAEEYFRITRDPLIQKFVPYACLDTLEETIECIDFYYANGDCINDFYVVIEELESHKLVGAIIATKTLRDNFDMAILIDSSNRHKGYMTEALLAFQTIIPAGSNLMFVIEKENKASYSTVSKLPNIQEKPFTGEKRDEFYCFVLSVWSHKTKALGRMPSAFCHFINNLI